MAEYAAVVEIWFSANDEDDATKLVRDLAAGLMTEEDVSMVEAGRPEEQ